MEGSIWEGQCLPFGDWTYVDKQNGNQPLHFTREFFESIIENTKRANALGKQTVATEGHPSPADIDTKSKGFGVDYYLLDDGLYSRIDVRNLDFAERLDRGEIEAVSPVISLEPFELPDGTRIEAPWIPYIGFTTEPRFPNTKKLRKLLNSLGLSGHSDPAPSVDFDSETQVLTFHNPAIQFTRIEISQQSEIGGDLMDKETTKTVETQVSTPPAQTFSAPVVTGTKPDPKIAILESALASQGAELKRMRTLEFTRQAEGLVGKKIAAVDVPLYVELCEALQTNTTLTFSAPAIDGKTPEKLTGLAAFQHLIANAPEQTVQEGALQRRQSFALTDDGRAQFVFSNPAIYNIHEGEDGYDWTIDKAKSVVKTLGVEMIDSKMKGDS